MKIIIFSDSHLTDRFEKEKFLFLKKIISNADKVIINGDFWDGYLTSFDNFVKSRWKMIFPLLKKRKTVYIYGNHDNKALADARVNLFSVYQGYKYTLKSGNITFHFEHGHDIHKLPDNFLPMFLIRIIVLTDSVLRYWWYLLNRSGLLNYYHSLNDYYRSGNKMSRNNLLIIGHSHGAEIAIKDGFANSGFIRWGYGSYLVCENGMLELKQEKY